jgi:hypothetical protein
MECRVEICGSDRRRYLSMDLEVPEPRLRLAPHARIRSQIVPAPSQIATPAAAVPDSPPKTTSQQPGRVQRWAELLARVFGLDMQKCVDCGGPLKIVSAILEPNVIRSILTYLRLPDKPPDLAPAQIPDQAQFS